MLLVWLMIGDRLPAVGRSANRQQTRAANYQTFGAAE